MKVMYDGNYICDDHQVDTKQKAADVAALLRSDPVPGVELVSPVPATARQLEMVHWRGYVTALMTGEPEERAILNGFGGWSPRLRDSVLASTGGVIAAARDAVAHRTNSGSLSSGLHHAKYRFGSGYCTVNGLVIAARVVLADGVRRVLVIDLDAHCGGGTAKLIEGVAGIEQVDVSVSEYDRYSGIPNARLVLSDGDRYLADIRAELSSVLDPTSIDLVLYNAGMDPHERCAIGGVPGITTEVLAAREEMVFAWAAEQGIPVAFVLAGGYSSRDLPRTELAGLHRLTVEAARLHAA